MDKQFLDALALLLEERYKDGVLNNMTPPKAIEYAREQLEYEIMKVTGRWADHKNTEYLNFVSGG